MGTTETTRMCQDKARRLLHDIPYVTLFVIEKRPRIASRVPHMASALGKGMPAFKKMDWTFPNQPSVLERMRRERCDNFVRMCVCCGRAHFCRMCVTRWRDWVDGVIENGLVRDA